MTNVQTNSSTLTWVPPPSLDLTDIDPDIAYCVEVYNITCGMRDLIISNCSVTEPSYTSGVIVDGYIYKYTITPRSNVPGARNGTSLTLQGILHTCQEKISMNVMIPISCVIVTTFL